MNKPYMLKEWNKLHEDDQAEKDAMCEYHDCDQPATIVFADDWGRLATVQCTPHAQLRWEAHAVSFPRYDSKATTGYRYFLTFDDLTHKNRARATTSFIEKIAHSDGNLLAIWLEKRDGSWREVLATHDTYSAYGAIFFHPNGGVTSTGVSREYLRDNALRISLQEAYQVGHTSLMAQINDDYQRQLADAAETVAAQ